MKLAPAIRLYGLGIILLLALTVCSRNFGDRGGPYFMASLMFAGIVYLVAIREFFATPSFPRHVIVFGLIVAAVWHVEFLRLPAVGDDDIHRYVWDGRVQRHGYNPYLVVPDDPAVKGLHTSETRSLNNPYLPSPYPPGAQLFFRAITGIHESTLALKVAFVVCDLAVVFVLLDVLRSVRKAEHWILAYAWHPLLATEVAGSGHVDIVGVLLLLMSMAALGRRWRLIAAVTFGLAVAVKFLPIVLVPLYWRRVRLRDAALAVVAVAITCLPFLQQGRLPFGSLGTYIHSFRFNDPAFAVLERIAAPRVVAGIAVFIGFLTAVWMRRRSAELSPDAFAWPMAGSLLFAPVIYPWYLLWLLPFLQSVETLPLVIWTVSILPTYYVWHLRALGYAWILPEWIMFLEYGSVAIAAAILISRRFTRRVV